MRLVGDGQGTVDSMGSGVVVAQPRAGVWNGLVVGIARDEEWKLRSGLGKVSKETTTWEAGG